MRGDMSVTAWNVMALKSAEMVGLAVQPAIFASIDGFLDNVAVKNGMQYGYQRHDLRPAMPVTAAVSAEGLLCRQYRDWPRAQPQLVHGVELLVHENEPDFDDDNKNVYAWYFITQATHNMGGELWGRWNKKLRNALPSAQVRAGRERGSWDPALDRWGNAGGRLFVTAFCACMLEVYYRCPPLYSEP
jgi:hypothetical protein